MPTDSTLQRGLTLIEVVVAIVGVAILATAFIGVFSTALKGSVSMKQAAVMEDLAASQLDKVLSGPFSASCTASSLVTIGSTSYNVDTLCSTITGGRHVDVSITCSGCQSVNLAGDAYDIW